MCELKEADEEITQRVVVVTPIHQFYSSISDYQVNEGNLNVVLNNQVGHAWERDFTGVRNFQITYGIII